MQQRVEYCSRTQGGKDVASKVDLALAPATAVGGTTDPPGRKALKDSEGGGRGASRQGTRPATAPDAALHPSDASLFPTMAI